MKTCKQLRLGNFGMDIGWFPGENWVLFQLKLIEAIPDYPTGFSSIELFRLGFLKFALSVFIDA